MKKWCEEVYQCWPWNGQETLERIRIVIIISFLFAALLIIINLLLSFLLPPTSDALSSCFPSSHGIPVSLQVSIYFSAMPVVAFLIILMKSLQEMNPCLLFTSVLFDILMGYEVFMVQVELCFPKKGEVFMGLHANKPYILFKMMHDIVLNGIHDTIVGSLFVMWHWSPCDKFILS